MGQCFAEAAQNGDLPRITRAFQAVVVRSFVKHPMRGEIGLQAEAKRRTLICEKWFRAMVEETNFFGKLVYGFSIDRALSQLGSGLDAELEGRSWEPDHATLWVPDRPILTS